MAISGTSTRLILALIGLITSSGISVLIGILTRKKDRPFWDNLIGGAIIAFPVALIFAGVFVSILTN